MSCLSLEWISCQVSNPAHWILLTGPFPNCFYETPHYLKFVLHTSGYNGLWCNITCDNFHTMFKNVCIMIIMRKRNVKKLRLFQSLMHSVICTHNRLYSNKGNKYDDNKRSSYSIFAVCAISYLSPRSLRGSDSIKAPRPSFTSHKEWLHGACSRNCQFKKRFRCYLHWNCSLFMSQEIERLLGTLYHVIFKLLNVLEDVTYTIGTLFNCDVLLDLRNGHVSKTVTEKGKGCLVIASRCYIMHIALGTWLKSCYTV